MLSLSFSTLFLPPPLFKFQFCSCRMNPLLLSSHPYAIIMSPLFKPQRQMKMKGVFGRASIDSCAYKFPDIGPITALELWIEERAQEQTPAEGAAAAASASAAVAPAATAKW
jgi:hypothetical protein